MSAHQAPHGGNLKRVVRLPCCVCKQVIDIEYCVFENVTGCPLAPAPIDTSFQFKCESCEGGGCFFNHSAKNWSQLLATAMYNMHQRQERFDYLFTDKILDFIEAHCDILKPILVGKNDMRTRLARALREHRESFESLMARSGQYKLKRMTYDDIQPRTNTSSSSIHSTSSMTTASGAPSNITSNSAYSTSTSNRSLNSHNHGISASSATNVTHNMERISPRRTPASASAILPSLSAVIGGMSQTPPAKQTPQDMDLYPPSLASSGAIEEDLYLGRFPLYYEPLPKSATHIVAWLKCTQCSKITKTDCNHLRGDNEDIKFMIPGPGDNEYSYWCPDCSLYEIFYHHNCKSWPAILATAMYNLERFHGRQYFSLDDGVLPFIETHWQVLCNGKSKQDTWKDVCREVIKDRGHSKLFVGRDGYWALRCNDVIPNIKNRLRVEKIVSRRKRGVVEECQVKWLGIADTFNTWIESGQIIVPNKGLDGGSPTSSVTVPWFNDVVFPPAPKPRALGTVNIKSPSLPTTPIEIHTSTHHSSSDDVITIEPTTNEAPVENQVPYSLPDQFMQCNKCLQIIEIDLSNARYDNTIYPGPHDANYTYTCSSCNGGKVEIIHLKKTSLEFLSTALQNLRIKKGYNEFHLNDIYVWSMENFHLLRTSIAATADSWKSNFRWVLSHNPDKFQSTQRGCWGLKVDHSSVATSATKSTSATDHSRDILSIKSLTTESKVLPPAKPAPNKAPPAPKWTPSNIPLTSEWQNAPPPHGRSDNSSAVQKGAYEFKPSEYFMPSYSPYPEWISSAMIPGPNMQKRKYAFPPPTIYNSPSCDQPPEKKQTTKVAQHANCSNVERMREVFLCSENERSFVGFVHISPKSSLFELRCKIQNEGVRLGTHDFIFLYKGVPVGREQEKRTFVKDCAIERLGKTSVSIREIVSGDSAHSTTSTTHNNATDHERQQHIESAQQHTNSSRPSSPPQQSLSSSQSQQPPSPPQLAQSVELQQVTPPQSPPPEVQQLDDEITDEEGSVKDKREDKRAMLRRVAPEHLLNEDCEEEGGKRHENVENADVLERMRRGVLKRMAPEHLLNDSDLPEDCLELGHDIKLERRGAARCTPTLEQLLNSEPSTHDEMDFIKDKRGENREDRQAMERMRRGVVRRLTPDQLLTSETESESERKQQQDILMYYKDNEDTKEGETQASASGEGARIITTEQLLNHDSTQLPHQQQSERSCCT